MRTIQHRIAGSATAGAPARFGPVYADQRRAHMHSSTATRGGTVHVEIQN